MEVNFFLAMRPPTVTHQEKKVRMVKGKPLFYEPPELKDARAKLTAYLSGHAPKKPFSGRPLELRVLWCFPADGRRGIADGDFRMTKPDTDNLQKLLKDCMTETGFWKDDALVARETVEKRWAVDSVPGIWIRVSEL